MVYLTIAEKSYPRKLAFSYLDELSKEFAQSYGAKVDTVRKPYAFVGFGELWKHLQCGARVTDVDYVADTFMSKTARLYQDTRTAAADSGLDRLNGELQDVTRIMTKNMEELLWRGDSLDSAIFFLYFYIVSYRSTDHAVLFRDVASQQLAQERERKVQARGAEGQLGRHDPSMGTSGRRRVPPVHLHLHQVPAIVCVYVCWLVVHVYLPPVLLDMPFLGAMQVDETATVGIGYKHLETRFAG